ncbi:unnamed protein product [Closterium sp. NIES-54]
MVDDYTRLTWSFPLAKKSDAARVIIEEWLPMVERESGKRVKAIRSDRGGEFLGAEFRSWLKRHGIKQQLTMAYTPQSNGVAERANRTIIEGGRTILVDSGLPLRFWPLAIRHVPLDDELRYGEVGRGLEARVFEGWCQRCLAEVGERRESEVVPVVSGGTGAAGSAGPAAAGATGVGAAGGVGAGGSADVGPSEGAGAGAAGAGGATGAGAPAGSPGAVPAGSGGASRPRPYSVPLLEQVLGFPPSPSPAPPLECAQPVQSQSLLQPVSPLPAPSPYTGPTGGLAERRAPASRPASPARPACTTRRTSRPRPPAVPGTHQMALRPSTAPLRVPLPSPPATSLPALPDPESDSLRAASPTVTRFLATVVTDPSLASTAASALVADLVDFAASCRLDYAASLVAECASVCPPSVGGEQPRSPPVLYVDNKAMLALCREHRLEHRTKHIALRYFLARELQQRGQLRLAYVASQANTADIFTKALAPGDHQRFCTLLSLVPTWPHLLTS